MAERSQLMSNSNMRWYQLHDSN